jgi:hypothetical protein
MPHPILITGAAGGQQGSTGRVITSLLLEQSRSAPWFISSIRGPMRSVNRVRKWSRATS